MNSMRCLFMYVHFDFLPLHSNRSRYNNDTESKAAIMLALVQLSLFYFLYFSFPSEKVFRWIILYLSFLWYPLSFWFETCVYFRSRSQQFTFSHARACQHPFQIATQVVRSRVRLRWAKRHIVCNTLLPYRLKHRQSSLLLPANLIPFGS
jgi:hypothetical protein